MANDIFDKMDVDKDGIFLRGRIYQVLSEKNAIFNMLTNTKIARLHPAAIAI